jgi:uracil phosphoribosyltransferase
MLSLCDHPLFHHNLSIVRDKNSSAENFRNSLRRMTQLLVQTATADLSVEDSTIETPLALAKTKILSAKKPILIVPILRAALSMSEVMLDLIPTASVYHLGLCRDEKTFSPITYYNKLSSTHARFRY